MTFLIKTSERDGQRGALTLGGLQTICPFTHLLPKLVGVQPY